MSETSPPPSLDPAAMPAEASAEPAVLAAASPEPAVPAAAPEPAVPVEEAQSSPLAPAVVPAPAQPGASAAATLSPADCGQQLKQLFPALFAGAIKPLKLRIQIDIQERAPGRFSKQSLSAFFRRHTGSTSYLIAVTKAPHRFDLDGQPAGEISAEHRQVALDELARRRDSQQSRRELEEQQRRNRAGLLHDFQATTLTKANFCALKGVPVEDLDGLLAMARSEAEERARLSPSLSAPQRHAGGGGQERDRSPGPGGRRGESRPGRAGGSGGGAQRRPR